MSGNTSATGGYLSPAEPGPTLRDLDGTLQLLVVALTGLPGRMVRPRFQENPAPIPDSGVDWAAVASSGQEPDWTGSVTHETPPGQTPRDVLVRYETFDLLASFYGPRSRDNAGRLIDGLMIPQNREGLRRVGIAVVGPRSIRNSPDLLNQRWYGATDVEIEMRREIRRVYPVLDLASFPLDFRLPQGVALIPD